MVLPVEVVVVTIRPAGVFTTVPAAGFGASAGLGRGAGLDAGVGLGAGLAAGNGAGLTGATGLAVGFGAGTGLGAGAGLAGVGFGVGVALGFGVAVGACAVAVGDGLGAGLAAKAGTEINRAAVASIEIDLDMKNIPSKSRTMPERVRMGRRDCPGGGRRMTNPSCLSIAARRPCAMLSASFNHGSVPDAH